MPRRNIGRPNHNNNNSGGGARFPSIKDYNEHDDRERRDHHGHSTRRVSFKPSQMNNNNRLGRHAERALKNHIDEDEDLTIPLQSKFDDRAPRRKGSPIPKGKFGSKKLVQHPFGWYQVTVSNGHHYSKDDVLRNIMNTLHGEQFIANYWRQEKNCVVFFIDDFSLAEKLQSIERSVQMSSGTRLIIRVRGNCPLVSVDEQFKERMKVTMSKRYNPDTKSLDLSKFYADPEFKNMFVGLFRTSTVSAAINIMEKNIPMLVSLNLSYNGIVTMESFRKVEERLPKLVSLNLAGNKITSLAHLLVLRNVPLTELVLEGNPLRARYKEQSTYVSEVQRKFPKLVTLDGINIEQQRGQGTVPDTKQTYICDVRGRELVGTFIEQYFTIFDTDNRQALLDAYHSDCIFSIIVPPASQAGRLTSFWKYNRNLKRLIVPDDAANVRMVKSGRLQTVALLAELPKTQHDPKTFAVDLSLFTPSMISFTVSGLFREIPTDTNKAPSSLPALPNTPENYIRYFNRQFLVVPNGNGICICNESFLVTSASANQIRSFIQHEEEAKNGPLNRQIPSIVEAYEQPTTSAAAAANLNRLQANEQQIAANAAAIAAFTAVVMPIQNNAALISEEDKKMQLVQQFSRQTNMNFTWSKKCLEEIEWDMNRAMLVFEEVKADGKIPPEAFI